MIRQKAIRLYATSMADAIIEARGNIVEELEVVAEKEAKKFVKKHSKPQPDKKVLTKKIAHAAKEPEAVEVKQEEVKEEAVKVKKNRAD